jgi:hypothetical protein
MKIQVDVFWDVTPCNVVVGYQRFGDLAASIFRVEVDTSRERRDQMSSHKLFKEDSAPRSQISTHLGKFEFFA